MKLKCQIPNGGRPPIFPNSTWTSNFFESERKRPQPPISTMIIQLLVVALHLPSATGFVNALFQKAPNAQHKAPSRTPDRVEIELPDFDELFNRIQQVSPLSQVAIESANDVACYTGGFGAIGKTIILNTVVGTFFIGAHIFDFFRGKSKLKMEKCRLKQKAIRCSQR